MSALRGADRRRGRDCRGNGFPGGGFNATVRFAACAHFGRYAASGELGSRTAEVSARFAGSVGGEGGIRTPVALAGKAVFKTAAFDRSATSPWCRLGQWAAKLSEGNQWRSPAFAGLLPVEQKRFELSTSALRTRRSSQLSYCPMPQISRSKRIRWCKRYFAKRNRTPALMCRKFTLGLVSKVDPLNTLLIATS